MVDRIPFPNYQSHFHHRITIPHETRNQIYQRWEHQPPLIRVLDAILSRILTWSGLLQKNRKGLLFKISSRCARRIFQLFNRLRIFGIQNIPAEGAIFYLNHPGQMDPLILMAASPVPISMLIAWGNGWFLDMLEYKLGLLSLRRGNNAYVIERIIRHLLTRNRYFAIWPEGHPTYKPEIEEGHSSIIKVYGVINHDKDRIPFVPVLLRGAECFRLREKTWQSKDVTLKRTNPLEVHFFSPIYLDRAWLHPLEQGGKSPRQMIDYLMQHLASKIGQQKLEHNRLLEWRRQKHAEHDAIHAKHHP